MRHLPGSHCAFRRGQAREQASMGKRSSGVLDRTVVVVFLSFLQEPLASEGRNPSGFRRKLYELSFRSPVTGGSRADPALIVVQRGMKALSTPSCSTARLKSRSPFANCKWCMFSHQGTGVASWRTSMNKLFLIKQQLLKAARLKAAQSASIAHYCLALV